MKGKMEDYQIINNDREVIDCVKAYNSRNALCRYLEVHEELEDAMLWRSPEGLYKLARYDDEDNFIYAKSKKESY